MRFPFIKNKGWSPSLAARGTGKYATCVGSKKKHSEGDPRERGRGKTPILLALGFFDFSFKKKKVFQAVGSKNRQEGGEAGGFTEKAPGRL